jgi:hypothetical protein
MLAARPDDREAAVRSTLFALCIARLVDLVLILDLALLLDLAFVAMEFSVEST